VIDPFATIPLPPSPTAEYATLYRRRLADVRTLAELRQLLAYWYPLVADAATSARQLTEDGWSSFRAGLDRALHYLIPAEDWHARFAPVLAPLILDTVERAAIVHQIPWGAAYNRLEFCGLLTRDALGMVHLKHDDIKETV